VRRRRRALAYVSDYDGDVVLADHRLAVVFECGVVRSDKLPVVAVVGFGFVGVLYVSVVSVVFVSVVQ